MLRASFYALLITILAVSGCSTDEEDLKPDLVVRSISASPATPYANEPATITVIVENHGAKNAGPFSWRLVRSTPQGSQPILSGSLSGLNEGASATITVPINEPAGTVTYSITINHDAAVSEEDLGNNTGTITLQFLDFSGTI